MNIDDGDDDKLKKARMVSLYNFKDRIFVLVIIGVICLLVLMITSYSKRSNNNNSLIELHNAYTNTERRVAAPMNIRKIPWEGCLYELPTSKDEIVPKHIVPPPLGDVTLVCCNTTKGVLNIEVHPTWAPRGADRFLSMVNRKFFSTRVGLFRALRNFLVQFGLAGNPEVQTEFHKLGNLPDDPPWLPLGPSGREINGTKRFQKGYLAYAGGGKNSRGTQLIMAFEDNLYLGGGSPWEVPWGQLVGKDSFKTLSLIYTGYGESPSQGKIMNRGNEYLEQEFPLMDYITACEVTRENVTWSY